jgi:hypothetical protein
MNPTWEASWLWGLSLIAVTIAIHALGIATLARLLAPISRYANTAPRLRRYPILLSAVILGTIGLLVALLHGLEAAIWAFAYLRLGATDTWHHAMLYSVDSLTTRGASGITLTAEWRLMGALEAAAGMLLFGISTAFAYAVIERIIRLRSGTGERS